MLVVLGVMGGLQKGYIDSILEISSFHIRVETGGLDPSKLSRRIAAMTEVSSVAVFRERHFMAMGPFGDTTALLVRSFGSDTGASDPGLVKALGLPEGSSFPDADGMTIGSEAAAALGIREGDEIDLYGLRQSEDEGLLPVSGRIPVKRVFKSGYYEFDSGMAFVSMPAPGALDEAFGPGSAIIGVKLKNRYADHAAGEKIAAMAGGQDEGGAVRVSAWREYNRSFFGALRTEKTIMMLLVGLIFAVVGINIYHSTRRGVAAKMIDIAVLKAQGATNADVRFMFGFNGFLSGAAGAAAGAALGLLVNANINSILSFSASVLRALAGLFAPSGRGGNDYMLFSPAYYYIENIPVSVEPGEVAFIVLAAVASAFFAAFFASRRVSESRPAEVLRHE